MTVNSLSPAFVQIQYHSAYAPHVMTLPTTMWTPDENYGLFETWAGGTKAADDMVEELILLMVPFFPSTVEFDYWTIFTKADGSSPSIPRIGKPNGEPGTAVAPGATKATQATWSFKTEGTGLSKIVMLDVNTNNSFEKVTPGELAGASQALVDKWTSSAEGWSGRDNTQPSFFLQIAYTINEKLRREYHMD